MVSFVLLMAAIFVAFVNALAFMIGVGSDKFFIVFAPSVLLVLAAVAKYMGA